MATTVLKGILLPTGFPVNTECRIGLGVRWWDKPPHGASVPIAFALGLPLKEAHEWGLRSGVYVRLEGEFQYDTLVISPDANPDTSTAQPALAWFGREAARAEGLLVSPARFTGTLQILYRESEATPVLFRSSMLYNELPASVVFAGSVAVDIPTVLLPTMERFEGQKEFAYSACHFRKPFYVLAGSALLVLVPRPAYVIAPTNGSVSFLPALPGYDEYDMSLEFSGGFSKVSYFGPIERQLQGTPPDIIKAFLVTSTLTSSDALMAKSVADLLDRTGYFLTAMTLSSDPDSPAMTEEAFSKLVSRQMTGKSASGTLATLGSAIYNANE